MILGFSKAGCAPAPRRQLARLARLAPALVAGVAALGCGIGESVMNECISTERVYERAQKRMTSLQIQGVPPDSPVRRAARMRLVEARSAYTTCVARYDI